LSASRTRQAYRVLSLMLDHAVEDQRLPRNPAAKVDPPRLPQGARRHLTVEQVEALAHESGEDRLVVLVLAYCAIRWGELAGLRVKRVDLLRRRLDVAEAASEVSGRVVWGTPKSHASRSMPIVRSIVRSIADELGAVLAGRGPDDVVFPAPEGGVLRVGNFRRRSFDRAATTIGVPGVVPHELRHMAASLAIAVGASLNRSRRCSSFLRNDHPRPVRTPVPRRARRGRRPA
jgi:integrase